MESILITGGTGSFGQAFTRYLLDNSLASRICIYSRGEHTQAAMRAAFNDDPRLRFFLGDVRDLSRLRRAMEGVDTVVHAAALKRIEVGYYNPDEMVKTNVLGAMNVVEAAHASGVENVVALSTDKAYMPISPYGQSKALAETIFLSANTLHAHGPKYSVVRYGNVWCAQGSVIPKWVELTKQHKVINVTSEECTRFFMTVEQAFLLVYGLILKPVTDRITIAEQLSAYRVGDLLTAFIQYMGKQGYSVAHTYSGLPHWEKYHESMEEGICSADAWRMTVDQLVAALHRAHEEGLI